MSQRGTQNFKSSRISYLWQESLVQSREALLLEDCADGWEGPVVLGNLTRDLGSVLDSALDDIERSVEDGTDSATNSTRDEVVEHLVLLTLSLGKELANLENATKVAGVPEDVSPHGALKTLVEGERSLVLDSLDDAVDHAIVLSSGSLILETNLDELERDDNE